MRREIIVCVLIAGLILVVAGVLTFMNGFHNMDLAFNYRTLEELLDITLVEHAAQVLLSAETEIISVNRLYNYGVTDIFKGMAAVFFGSLMVGYTMNREPRLKRGKARRK